LEALDREGASAVALVNRSMADRYWPSGALAGTLRPRFAGFPPTTVVGVAGDVHWRTLVEEPTNFVFFPLAQAPARALGPVTLVVRTDGDLGELLTNLRARLNTMDPDLSLGLVTTMEEVVGDLLMPQRIGSMLLSAFGVLALLLAAIGIAGVVSYTVGAQRRSIGVRIALGARSSEVLALLVREMAVPVGLGLGVGLALSAILDGTVERFLYGVSPGDLPTYLGIAALLGGVALAATLIPARAATRIDPLEALRAE
jgi:hypothetical protein